MGFDPTRYGPFFRYASSSVIGSPGAPWQIVPPSPYRVGIIFGVTGTNITINPVVAPSGSIGIVLSPGNSPMRFMMSESGPLCQQLWWGGPVTGSIYVVEILYQPGVSGEF